jgi:SAM-dependent methyltransferase
VSSPTERVRALLSEPPARIAFPKGYVDALRGDEPSPPWWRPLLGVAGFSEAEGRRSARLLLGLRPGDLVLDVGCGRGDFARELAAVVGAGGLAVGVDARAAALERASGEGAAFVRGDPGALPFRDETFDAVCCLAPPAPVDEMARVLAPGGRIALLGLRREALVEGLQARGFTEVHQRVHGLTQLVGGRSVRPAA